MFEEVNLRPSLPQIGYKAPDFTARSTFGDIRLSDFKGKWVVLFSHPADFTPVCTTELLAFAMYFPYFYERNVQLIGLSVDSIYSHLAWVYNIYRNTGVEIPFPIIADLNKEVAVLYGMLSPAVSDTAAVRSVFIIDDNQVIRAVLQYPQSTGRYIPEILRIIDSLQLVDKDGISTPANWVPSMPVIQPAPNTWQQLRDRVSNPQEEGLSCVDWYLCFKPDTGRKELENGKEKEKNNQIGSGKENQPANENQSDNENQPANENEMGSENEKAQDNKGAEKENNKEYKKAGNKVKGAG